MGQLRIDSHIWHRGKSLIVTVVILVYISFSWLLGGIECCVAKGFVRPYRTFKILVFYLNQQFLITCHE